MINGRKIVALCTYRIYESQEFVFISRFNKMLVENGYYLFIYALNSEIGNTGNEVAEVAVFDLIDYDKTDVVVIMDEKIKSVETTQMLIDRAHSHKVPVVVVDGEYEGVSLVKYDYAAGFEEVVRHMIEYHHVRRPHFMAGKKGNRFSEERIDVFKKVIAENGIDFDESMLSYGDFWSVPAREAANKILEREEIPEAIICANDIMAINVCDLFGNAGIKVPGDMLVSGFDGIDEAYYSSPSITTATCDSNELARAVTETVTASVERKEIVLRTVAPRFVANESCGCSKCKDGLQSYMNSFNNSFYHHQDDIHVMQFVTSKMMIGRDMEWNIQYLKRTLVPYGCLVIEDTCFNMENNFFFDDASSGGKTVVYDSYSESNEYYPYDPVEYIPHLDVIMEKNCPIIFNGLEYMAKSPGFICYSFPRIDVVDYNQTPDLTNCFGMGIGGLAVYEYQQYLREKIQMMYQNDALTGLYNRLAFISRYEELLRDEKNYGKKATVFLADLNGLKKINDNLGHLEGDKAIASVASALKRAVPPDSICVRVGGDEMMAFILGDHNCDKVIDEVEEYLKKDSEELGFRVSASIGTYTATFDKNLDMNKLIGMADKQMYEIKRKSKEEEKRS